MSKSLITYMILFIVLAAGGTYLNLHITQKVNVGGDQVHVVSIFPNEEPTKPVPVGTFQEVTLDSLDEANRNFAKTVMNEEKGVITHNDLVLFTYGNVKSNVQLEYVRQEVKAETSELKLYVKVKVSEINLSSNEMASKPYVLGKIPYAEQIKVGVYDVESGKPIF